MYRNTLAYFLEDLWSKGFKLSDEDVQFIYFGKNSANAPEWKTIVAVKMTLKVQQTFDPSFFISILEHIAKTDITNKRMAYESIEEQLSIAKTTSR
ncbi:hypothetical protein SAMN05192559_104220 [Halobacillus karajensis]|uniref:Uncharacterized protein n=1 Tax=Halobacillus karajensis TaxID=195088 RepID=A0A024P1J6_9BACI|nr:DUF6123 family protein [Halobacillus karajensis]CDQ19553.1 hypothetical protein BN982_01850 [Halobacillus karajensis]CDQ22015.1 hypothetical protein BN983_00213 [Halobacillus karajensis]CDQ27856.1 hypothetical protein BN981_02140 [Halobacillus karajensis]SEH80375.1 hypothetical protein SAMN05192559_104220 [Halobacillus karajensis]